MVRRRERERQSSVTRADYVTFCSLFAPNLFLFSFRNHPCDTQMWQLGLSLFLLLVAHVISVGNLYLDYIQTSK